MPPKKHKLQPLTAEQRKAIEDHRNALLARTTPIVPPRPSSPRPRPIVAARKSVIIPEEEPLPPKRKKKEDRAAEAMMVLQGMKKGGMVKETKPHLLHKGEMVIPADLVKHLHKLIMHK